MNYALLYLVLYLVQVLLILYLPSMSIIRHLLSSAKLSQVDACLADLNLEKDHLVQGIEAIDKMNPAALDSDQGMIETTQPIHEQILMCFAQDAALSDAIITLGEGFHHGLFPEGLESYLKKVRALSRQQFYLRATMIKARQVSGLQSESS